MEALKVPMARNCIFFFEPTAANKARNEAVTHLASAKESNHALSRRLKLERRNDARATMFITLVDTLAIFINSAVSAQALGDFQIEKSAATDADGALCPS